jgi:flagellar L-ring protein precursor FlgH
VETGLAPDRAKNLDIGGRSVRLRFYALTKIAAVATLFLLAGCGASERIRNIGKAPDLTPLGKDQATRQPLTTLPMPAPDPAVYQPNSLWRSGARAFFKDQRAAKIGDILTVSISIDDKGKINNTTSRSRTGSEKADLTSFLGYEGTLSKFLPNDVNPASLTSLGSTSSTVGAGSVDRAEAVNLTVAALVTQVLPNGNLVIQGRQEVRVNNEVRDLYLNGIVRPEDISSTNTINHTQIAEARISYGGRGQLSDVQQARYGQQLYDIVFPF